MKRQASIYVLCQLFDLTEGSMVLWTSLIIVLLLRIPRWQQQNIKARNGFLVTFSVGGFICWPILKHYHLHQLEYVNRPLFPGHFSYITLPTMPLFIYFSMTPHWHPWFLRSVLFLCSRNQISTNSLGFHFPSGQEMNMHDLGLVGASTIS